LEFRRVLFRSKDEILELKQKGSTIIFSTHRMESVEELCDEIALIHKSEKLLAGSLVDIKKQYRSNTFDLGINVLNPNQLKEFLNAKYQIEDTFFKSLDNELKLAVKLNDKSANELLNDVLPFGQITHFAEKIPSINDIFIQTVTNN